MKKTILLINLVLIGQVLAFEVHTPSSSSLKLQKSIPVTKDLDQDLYLRQKHFQERIWNKAALAPFTSAWNFLQKEKFIQDLEEENLSTLRQLYPTIPLKHLGQAKDALYL